MDAIKFLKERKRLCLTFDCCDDCPLATDLGTCSFEKRHELNESEVVAQVEQWTKEHPVKTRRSEFLKMFPNANVDNDGVLYIRPCTIDTVGYCIDECTGKCYDCRHNYWLTEIE